MRHLIVTALHRSESFLSQGTKKLVASLKENGNRVEVRDLYKDNFQAILTTDDFERLKMNDLPEDIQREQDFITEADYMWIVFPIWWTSMPAILKGYIDRVFLNGFAYTMNGDRPVGLLKGKKVIIINSMGMSYKEYEESGTFEALKLTIDKGIFEFTGIEVVEHKYFASIMSADEDTRNKYFNELIDFSATFSKGPIKQLEKETKKKVA